MAPDPILQEKIYERLKADLRSGHLRPDQHIDLQAISDFHRASVTPVREAVCRLIGEGLAEFQRYGGFRVRTLDDDQLRELYMFNTINLSAAIRMSNDRSLDGAVGSVLLPGHDGDPIDLAVATAGFFTAISLASGNSAIVHAVENVSDRLASARIAEASALRDAHGEFLMFSHGPKGDLRKTLLRRIAAYHRRRINQAMAIVRLI